jgi:hypothetical protein
MRIIGRIQMDVSRTTINFADAVEALLAGHRSKVFSVVTIDGKQERGYAPVTLGADYLQCHSADGQNVRIYPLRSLVSITPAG